MTTAYLSVLCRRVRGGRGQHMPPAHTSDVFARSFATTTAVSLRANQHSARPQRHRARRWTDHGRARQSQVQFITPRFPRWSRVTGRRGGHLGPLRAGDAAFFVDCSARFGPAHQLGQRRVLIIRFGPHWGNDRYGYQPSDGLLARLTPQQLRTSPLPRPSSRRPSIV